MIGLDIAREKERERQETRKEREKREITGCSVVVKQTKQNMS